MPLETTGSVGTEEVPVRTQVRWTIRAAAFEPDGQYGPDIALDLDITDEQYLGAGTKYWAKIQQPRLDKVRKLRKDGLDDETIATVLKKQGFKFDRVDEPDKMVIGRSGALYSVLLATQGGDRKKAEAVIKLCDSFHDLAAHLEGGTFVGTTKLSKDGYLRLDLTEEVYPDVEARDAMQAETDGEIDELAPAEDMAGGTMAMTDDS
jgi:hypothetical protein